MKENKDIERLARDIYDWCREHHLWGDNIMYFKGKAWASFGEWGGVYGRQIDDRLYEYDDKNPRDYFEYVRQPENLFSMSFEGSLYEVLNAYSPGWVKLESQFIKIFAKYGLYYEMGHAWNLTAYEI